MSKSIRKSRARKAASRPKKPYPDFPLTPHASGAWQKKIGGKVRYFGRWARRVNGQLVRLEGDGWKEALELYKAQADDLHAGRTPRPREEEKRYTIKDLCNHFHHFKENQHKAGELSARMLLEYELTTDRLLEAFDKTCLIKELTPDDFARLRTRLAERYGPVRLGNEIQKVKTIFNYALDQELIDRPLKMGKAFKKPSKLVMRLHRAKTGKRLFAADGLRRLIQAAGVPLRAMILLGINAGFGNADCGRLTLEALDLEKGWITFPRPKTGIERRAFLWPETVQALKDALAERPDPKNEADANLVFITKQGASWAKQTCDNPITKETAKLLHALKLHRDRMGFYALRHTFRTVADATCDFPAVRFVMGHADDSIDNVYREEIKDGRLMAVARHVREWLFGTTPEGRTSDRFDPQETGTSSPAPQAIQQAPPDQPALAQPLLKLFDDGYNAAIG
jgi:integrase